MHRALKIIRTLQQLALCVACMAVGTQCLAAGQTQRKFEDVPAAAWPYAVMTALQHGGILSGYRAGYFDGRRTLTRYEFAIALHSALSALPASSATYSSVTAAGPQVSSADLLNLRKLVVEFKDELVPLGMTTSAALSRLDKLAIPGGQPISPRITDPDRLLASLASHLNAQSPFGQESIAPNHATPNAESVSSPSGSAAYTASAGGSITDPASNAFQLQGRIGSASANVWAGGFDLLGISAGDRGMQRSVPGINGSSTQGGLLAANSFPSLTQSGAGFHLDLPVAHSAQFGLTVADFASDDALSPNSPNVMVYGGNLNLHPFGRLELGAEGARSVLQWAAESQDPGGDENGAYRVNLGYNAGAVRAEAGYQYVDPGFGAPGYFSQLGAGYDLSNSEGPFVRLGLNLGRSVQGYVGGDYLEAARSRSNYTGLPGFGGLNLGDSVTRASAGVRWSLTRWLSLRADYEGVFWNSTAGGMSGFGAMPMEQYFTIGTGLNLSRSAMFKLGYQMITVRDPNGGSAGSAATPDGLANTTLFTTEVAIHF